ncbi:ankyrin repeats (3 copies) domain-containing protein [Ditylenchus destructor]|nr:ankyrin repeats (3 copies) domain-containing protein [Ditylenchus destructor]
MYQKLGKTPISNRPSLFPPSQLSTLTYLSIIAFIPHIPTFYPSDLQLRHGPSTEKGCHRGRMAEELQFDTELIPLRYVSQRSRLLVGKSQLEYRLKKWKILKYIDCDSWKYIDQTINKRKREGKESDVLLCGKRVKQSTIEKQTNHHRDERSPAQNLSGLSYTQLQKMTSEHRASVLNLLTSKILLVDHEFDQSQASHLIPRLAMNLVMGMPEYFPGEHLQTAQTIATGITNVMMLECLKLIFYKVSNNMVSTWEADDFENLHTLISKTGLLSAIDSLRRARQQDLTIRAFMDNLFGDLILFICNGKRLVNVDNPTTLVKWLLSLGQDPNIGLWSNSFKTPLEYAISSRKVDLIEPLLEAGAVIRMDRETTNIRSIMSLVLPDRICDNEGTHIIRLLLRHYKFLTAEEVLHAAILLQDERLLEQALDIGAEISLPIETLTDDSPSVKSKIIKEETALSTAAGVSIHATSVVFSLLQNHNQAIKAASFITPDVFISAARAGNADVILFLHEINPIGFRRNTRGVMPLEVAIKHGHQEAYQLLFQLYRQSSATLLLIPIFTDQVDILKYLLTNGLDVNLPMHYYDIDACMFLVPNADQTCSWYSHESPTVLEFFLCDTSATENWNDGIKLLIRSGAFLPAEAILELSRAGHDDILSAALDAGGDPNVQDFSGNSALAYALRNKNTNCVQLLLKRGAKLHTLTPEVFEAFVPEHICNIQGERGGCDPGLRALFLKYWANLFDTSKDSLCDIDAAIIAQHDSRLKSAFSELPTYYSPSSLCSAVLVENHWVIDFLLTNRPLQAPDDVSEGTAVGLAAMIGNLSLVRKLIAQLQKPETAVLPFYAGPSTFSFSDYHGLEIGSSHIFWHGRSNDNVYTLVKGSPLALAVSYRGTAGVLELLSHGYQPDDTTWARAISTDTPDCLKALIDYNKRVRSLQLPILTLSPLLAYAIQHEMDEAVVWLIESGADIDENDVHRYMGRSPLQLAIERGHLTIAERLLRSEAKVDAAPCFYGGATALQRAAIRGYIGLAKQLLDAGARVNARGSRKGGRTALEGAAEHGRLDMVELLLYHRALTTGPGRFQFIRAIRFAEREGHNATAALLRQSREWTDEHIHTYGSMCAGCNYCFSEPRPSSTRCCVCNRGYTRGRYCCDEIHMPEDDCYHCYTEDEENRYELEMREEEESESEEEFDAEEGVESADDD